MFIATLYRRSGKRFLDCLLAAIALLLLLPVFMGVAALVRWKLGSPVFFKQRRPGRFGEPFMLLKFRTMRDTRDDAGVLLPDAERQTGFGNFLRSTSLDELPELLNVLKGEMSLVGPRPLLMDYLPRYSPEQAHRHDVVPGITGWAQINGRNLISWEEKFDLDLWYVGHQSLWLDLKILVLTVRKVIIREGVSAPEYFSSPDFMGSPIAESAGGSTFEVDPPDQRGENRLPVMVPGKGRELHLSDRADAGDAKRSHPLSIRNRRRMDSDSA